MAEAYTGRNNDMKSDLRKLLVEKAAGPYPTASEMCKPTGPLGVRGGKWTSMKALLEDGGKGLMDEWHAKHYSTIGRPSTWTPWEVTAWKPSRPLICTPSEPCVLCAGSSAQGPSSSGAELESIDQVAEILGASDSESGSA